MGYSNIGRVVESVPNSKRILPALVAIGVSIVFSLIQRGSLALGLILNLAWLAANLYFWTQATDVTKKVVGLKVVDMTTGQNLPFGQMFLREFVLKGIVTVITCGIAGLVGLIMILTSSDRTAWWDRVAKSRVVAA
jgi:hypothetical protein